MPLGSRAAAVCAAVFCDTKVVALDSHIICQVAGWALRRMLFVSSMASVTSREWHGWKRYILWCE